MRVGIVGHDLGAGAEAAADDHAGNDPGGARGARDHLADAIGAKEGRWRADGDP